MKNIGFVIVVLFGICLLGSGCGVFETSDATSSSSNQVVESVFNSAMTAASNALANGQNQELAVAAAEAIVASQVTDTDTQAVFNQVVESEVPLLANSLSASLQDASVSSNTTDAKNRSIYVKTKFQKSNTFKEIVKNCIKKYEKIQKK